MQIESSTMTIFFSSHLKILAGYVYGPVGKMRTF